MNSSQILDQLARNIEKMDKARDQKPPNMEEVFRLTDEQVGLSKPANKG